MTNLSSRILKAIRASESSSEEIAVAIEALGKKPEPIAALIQSIAPTKRSYRRRDMKADA
jgi:hypothetical protein